MVREGFKRPRGQTAFGAIMYNFQGTLNPNSKRTWTLLIVGATIINVWIQVAGPPRCESIALMTHKAAETSPPALRREVVVPAPAPPLEDPCDVEYKRVTADRTQGLTKEDLKRSWTNTGNRQRLAQLGETLNAMKRKPRPIKGVVSGGSISLGHGAEAGLRYSDRLEKWFNDKYPIPEGEGRHQILNKGSHGADICAMAKRLNLLFEDLPPDIDLFVLEFAVNDYQGQDHERQIDFKMDVFYDGFDRIATCAETVIYKLLRQYPRATILFLEMRTAILGRKTASLLHMGAAQHYQIPVIDYSEAMFPDYQFLLQLLKPFNYSTAIGDTVLPYPHGCHPCVKEHIVPGFRANGCADVCTIMKFNPTEGPLHCQLAQGREPCYVPFFAHDEVHPSGIGHQIASDLIIDAIASTARDVCNRERFELAAAIPRNGWMVSSPDLLDRQNAFVMVNDTYEVFVKKRKLEAATHTDGFSYFDDKFGRFGWIATNEQGGESIQFDIQQPAGGCYIPVLSVLKSYEGMGTFTVTVTDKVTKEVATVEGDGLWKPKISVPVDIQLLQDGIGVRCTGNCQVNVQTHPKKDDRKGNKVKVVSLAVRHCV
ncbi:expressed unknown protein [Seminavis robusta]|uniref:SGNH hydrolase-type esterase domain-containing protein n=1 Tax=Seminavis robusta TaxID=568900 RepID=A0A9N8H427_9STRA|nr:expressed unknown protein [Seminavis robusta]|eukprot:Sro75_g041080.1 n/a (598) ;mRNA; r:35049-36926